MAHEWDRGILTHASWHGLEALGVLVTAEDIINAGENSGAWPVTVRRDQLETRVERLSCPLEAIIADYKSHDSRCLSGVGGRFEATSPEKWRELVQAAVKAGAKPTGAFSLRNGTRVLATFEVGEGNGLKSHLVMADAFDGSMKLTCGFTSIRVVCANTLSAAMSCDGKGMAALRHTSTINEKIESLGHSIEEAIKTGQAIKDLYAQAEETRLNRDEAEELLALLFPMPGEGHKSAKAVKSAKTRAENKRKEALQAAALPINRVGDKGTAATIWNAATYLVDRKVDGSFRSTRGGDRLDSMLFGSRAERVAKIERVMIQVLRPDGSEVSMSVDQAMDAGVPANQIGGSNLIEDILANMGQSN